MAPSGTGHSRLRVFISSTYLDNQNRRKLVEDAILRAEMVPVGMERFAASANPAVDECLRMAAECEVYVGIVAHRYGWEPKGHGGKSITWLEYEAAKSAGRPRLMFEIDPALPLQLADMDAGPGRGAKQDRLDQFRSVFRADEMPAQFREETLQGAVLDSLNKHLARLRPHAEPAGDPAQAVRDGPLADALGLYRDAMLAEHGSIELGGFATKLRVPIAIEDLYIPLRAMVDRRACGDAVFPDAGTAKQVLDGCGSDEILLADALRCAQRLHRTGLVMLGEPGSGKTTHLKRLLITCWRDSPATLWLSADMVPVFLPLRRFARGRLSDFIDREMNPELLARVGAGFGARLLERGRALLLFDGLDEVADPGQRVEVVRWVEKVAAANPTCVPVVTCRFAGYGRQAGAGRGLEEVRLGEKFLEVHVRPLDRGQTERFVRNWYRIVETGLESDQAKAERRVKVTEKGGVELVEISGGKFLMGSLADEPERSGWEGPVHEVTLSPFWLGRFPVTNKEYGRYLKENPSAAEPALWGDRRFNQVRQPVVGVSWEDAAAFAAWARCRLPTEAEWDYGCRAGTTGMRYAEDLNSIAWYDKNSGGQTHAVGTKTPNAWGLCDMLGNVWEWCADWHGAYDGVAVTNPAGLKGGRGRVGRGGSWFDPAVVCRSAFRYGRLPVDRYRNLGFRLASGQ